MRARDPKLYMERPLGCNAIAQDNEVARHVLRFKLMLNALRLKDGFALWDFSARTGLSPATIEKSVIGAGTARSLS